MKIFLGGDLNFYHPEKEKWLDVELETPTSIAQIIEQLDIPSGEVYLVVLNGEAVDINTNIASQKDEVKLFPPVGGG
jgi:sulfur carrier protein ThiS